MKFRDNVTGNVIECNNDFVNAQYKKFPDRYKEIKIKDSKSAKKAEKE